MKWSTKWQKPAANSKLKSTSKTRLPNTTKGLREIPLRPFVSPGPEFIGPGLSKATRSLLYSDTYAIPARLRTSEGDSGSYAGVP